MELGPTGSDTGRSWFQLSSACDSSRYYRAAHGTALIPTETQFPCRTLVARQPGRRATPLLGGRARDVAAVQLLVRDPLVLRRRAGLHHPFHRPEIDVVRVGHLPHVLPFAAAEEGLELVGLRVVAVVHGPLDRVLRDVLRGGAGGRERGVGVQRSARIVVDGVGLVPAVARQVVGARQHQVRLVELGQAVFVTPDLLHIGWVRRHMTHVAGDPLARYGLGRAARQVVRRAAIRKMFLVEGHPVTRILAAPAEGVAVARGCHVAAVELDAARRSFRRLGAHHRTGFGTVFWARGQIRDPGVSALTRLRDGRGLVQACQSRGAAPTLLGIQQCLALSVVLSERYVRFQVLRLHLLEIGIVLVILRHPR